MDRLTSVKDPFAGLPAHVQRRFRALLARPELAASAEHFRRACEASRIHSMIAAEAFKGYGDHGPLISGCVRVHFPEYLKDTLRDVARRVTTESEAAHAARPKRIAAATMRELAQAIATRDGAGFYGPQPYRAAITPDRRRA